MDFIKIKPVDLWIADSPGNLIRRSNEVCLSLAPAVIPGLHWKEISAVTFDMGGRLCLSRVPAAQISHVDSSSPWLTRCPENTSLLTNTSFLTTSHIRSHALCTYKYSFRHIDAPTHMLSHVETWQKINLILLQFKTVLLSDVVSHIVNHSRQKMSGFYLNHEAPKSYFHYNRSIPQRGHEVRWTLTPGFVAHTDDTPRAWPGCQGDVTPPFQIGSHFGARVSDSTVSLIALGRKVGLTGECDNTWFSSIPLGKKCLE